MKKYLGMGIMGVAIAVFSIVLSSYEKQEEVTEEGFTYSDVSKFLRENVFTKLEVLSPYSAKKSFSRCPSGFSHNLDEKQSGNIMAFGTIYNAEGCSRYPFCNYMVDMVEKEVFLKNLEEDTYQDMATYIEVEKEKKVAKI